MKVIRARNVNDALLLGIDLFNDDTSYKCKKAAMVRPTKR